MSNATFASEAQITRAIVPMLADRDWVNSVQVTYAQRAGQIAAAIRFANEPNEQVAALLLGCVEMGEAINVIAAQVGWKPLDRKGASALITWLGTLPRLDRRATVEATCDRRQDLDTPRQDRVTVTQEGFYLAGDTAYRVRESKRNPGRFYAEAATAKGWHREAGAVYRLTPDMLMSAAQVAAFGHRAGFCVNCSTGLSDPISQHVGLGTACGPRILGAAGYRAARKQAIATSPECAAFHAQQLASQRARRAQAKARAA